MQNNKKQTKLTRNLDRAEVERNVPQNNARPIKAYPVGWCRAISDCSMFMVASSMYGLFALRFCTMSRRRVSCLDFDDTSSADIQNAWSLLEFLVCLGGNRSWVFLQCYFVRGIRESPKKDPHCPASSKQACPKKGNDFRQPLIDLHIKSSETKS